MHIPTLIKYTLLAWGVPLAIVLVAWISTPDPDLGRSDFPSQSFKPSRVWIAEKRGTKRSDHFELRLESPKGEEFFHRDPEREPVADLFRRFPKGAEIKVLYSSGVEGNVLMEIVAADPPFAVPLLSFEKVMDEYASRRRLVHIVATVWCVLANLFAFALWKVDVSPAKPRSNSGPGGA